MKQGKLVLIDGHSILNRAFYGIPELSNAKGLHTNAVYGFLNIMFKILEEEQADYLAVAFDVKAPTFRHELYPEYKGTRKPMPEELREQVPVMKQVLQAMGILIMEQPGLEADDILGTMAKRAEKEGLEVALVSGDRDLLQIASEHIKIRIPKTRGAGRTEVEDYYAADVFDKYHVTPEQFIELKALMGDTADNIPGVPKVGEKTATELMVTYGSIQEIYGHLEEISKKSIRESLAAHRELADLSKILATINIESGISYRLEDAKIGDFYTEEAYLLFKELEFKNMLGRFEKKVQHQEKKSKAFQLIREKKEAEAVFDRAEKAGAAGFFLARGMQTAVDAPGHNEQLSFEQVLQAGVEKESFAGLGLCFAEEEIFYLQAQSDMDRDYLLERLRRLPGILCCFNSKRCYEALQFELEDTQRMFDVLIAAYLLNPLKNDYEPEDIAAEYLGLTLPNRTERFGKKAWTEIAASEEFPEYACYQAYIAWKGKIILEAKLQECGMERLFSAIEMPLSYILYDMEKEGIRVKPDELKAYGQALVSRIEELEKQIHEAAGCVFNINSPKQLGEILFEKLKLPGGKKTKTGYSTAADVLDKLSEEHEIVKDVLEYRGLTKLKSTYADGLAVYIGAEDRIHSTFNQTITATGRISSTEPNLQNIPMRMELGRAIRKVFVPKEGCLFMDADYSQIELRVLAHMSNDEQLIEAYRQDEDIHRITATKVFHTPFEEVTDLQRRNAKAVNFGIVYGISSFGLSQDLSITRKEAAAYIDQYFATYPSVKEFLDRLVEEAKKTGYAVTMFGRRRPVPELASGNFMQRSFGERVAMNSPIQGTAADIIKIAMIEVYKGLKEAGLKTKLILQVHDELLLEVRQEETEAVREILRDRMQSAAKLSVSLEVDLHTGANWYETK